MLFLPKRDKRVPLQPHPMALSLSPSPSVAVRVHSHTSRRLPPSPPGIPVRVQRDFLCCCCCCSLPSFLPLLIPSALLPCSLAQLGSGSTLTSDARDLSSPPLLCSAPCAAPSLLRPKAGAAVTPTPLSRIPPSVHQATAVAPFHPLGSCSQALAFSPT